MRISAVLTNYNCGRFLPEALRSVLEQTPAPSEVLVVDDGSTDDSRQKLPPFLDRARFLGRPHAGQAAALNAALALCRGDWIAFLETDDVWTTGKLAAVEAAAREHPELCAVQHSLIQADAALRPLATELPAAPLLWTLEDFLADRTLLTGLSGLSVRREVLLKLLPLPEDLLTCVDEYLQPRLLELGPMLHLPGSHGLRRIHSANHYAGALSDPARLQAHLRLRGLNARHREDFLRGRGLSLSRERLRREQREGLELELFAARLQGRWGAALKAWLGSVRLCKGPYALFKAAALAPALLSPRLHVFLRSVYARLRLARLRRLLLP